MMCWWAEEPNGDEFKNHLARVPDWLWLAEDGMKMQVRILLITIDTLKFRLIQDSFEIVNSLPDKFTSHLLLVLQSLGSPLWDCAFATQALLSSCMIDECLPSLKKAHFYIRESQVQFFLKNKNPDNK